VHKSRHFLAGCTLVHSPAAEAWQI